MAQEKNQTTRARLPVGKRVRNFLLCLGAALLLVLGAYGLFRFAQGTQPYELTAFSMGSYVRQTIWGPRRERAAPEAANALTGLENLISWRREGDVSRLNQQAGQEPVSISPRTQGLLQELLELCRKSEGAFDITLGPVTRLWDFDSSPHLPKEEDLAQALALTGWQDVELEGDRARLARPDMALDLGAAGKGAACDEALTIYRELGVNGAVIAVGGSIGLYGKKPDGLPFRVSVRDPEGEGSLGVLELEGGFVSTSGSYEKFFQQDGKTYCHLLDPRTGYPAEGGLVSVTVWHPESGALSDGLATACFVLGLQDSLALLREYNAQAIFVDQDGLVTVTEGLADCFSLEKQALLKTAFFGR